MDLLIDILLDAGKDTLSLVPFLLVTYLALETLEHVAGDRVNGAIKRAGAAGPVVGSLLGMVPQCGFSAMAATLYAGRVVTLGTLVAVFLSTSDEMLPLLLAEQVPVQTMAMLLASKALIALVTGFIVDAAIRGLRRNARAHAAIRRTVLGTAANPAHVNCAHDDHTGGDIIVLNPVFFVPFVFAPIANIWILKIFIDFLGMNGFMYTLPWTVPGPIGTIMGLGFQPLAFVMLALILVVDFALYYPFFRAYDAQKCAEEAEISQEELAAKNAEKAAKLNDAFQGKADAKSVAAGAAAEAVKSDVAPAATEATATSDLNGKRVLVLCQGGGTSGLLANALAKAAKERGINLETAAEAYGNHVDMLPDFDLVVLAPQAASYLADLQKDCERVGNKCVACRGKQYIELSQNGDKSLAFVSEQLSK